MDFSQYLRRIKQPNTIEFILPLQLFFYFYLRLFSNLFFFNKINKNQLRLGMESSIIKEQFQTQVVSNEHYSLNKQFTINNQELITINDIMDQIHEEVVFKKMIPNTIEKYKQNIQCKKWSKRETQDFYSVLSMIGPDFTGMESHQLFSERRSKKELKNKYRKEQKKDDKKVNLALDKYYDKIGMENIKK